MHKMLQLCQIFSAANDEDIKRPAFLKLESLKKIKVATFAMTETVESRGFVNGIERGTKKTQKR